MPNNIYAAIEQLGLTAQKCAIHIRHHNDQSGLLNLVDRGDHANNHGIYHPDGTGGRDKWGGGKPGRQGKLDQATGCPL